MENYGRIAVLAGGPSSEREISLKSGRAVSEALIRKKQDVRLIDVDENFAEKIKNLKANVVFIALHGRFGEDGTVQAMLDEMGMPYTGSGSKTSRLALDKIASREVFFQNGLTVPGYKVVEKGRDHGDITSEFAVPFVVKPQWEGSSIGLSIVRNESELQQALDKAFKYGERVLIEEYIHGKELTVGILENQILPVIEIVAKNRVYDFDAKYEDKDTEYVVPADLIGSVYEKARAHAMRAHDALGCRDFSRVDMRMDEEGNIFILEVNTIPGLTERSLLPKAALAAGVNFEDLCLKLVGLAYKRRK